MWVRACHSKQSDSALIRPDPASPHFRGYSHRPQSLGASLELGIGTAQYNARVVRIHATFYHAKQQTLDHAVQTRILRLLVRKLNVLYNRMEQHRPHVGRRRHAQQRKERLEEKFTGNHLAIVQQGQCTKARLACLGAKTRMVL